MNRIAAVIAGLSLAFVGTSNAWAQLGPGACCLPDGSPAGDGVNCLYFDDLFAEELCVEAWGGVFHAGQSCSEVACPSYVNVPGDYPTIQGAINASSNGDVINIAAGTYNEHSLNPGGKAITIQGTVNGDGTLATTIDALLGGSVFVVNSGEGNGTVIRDLVITGGSTSGGGGINCDFSSPTISGCRILDNTATYYGGGIYCGGSNPTISGCTILDNRAPYGGGIYCGGSNPTISGCRISNNTAYDNGGGIYGENLSIPTISNCMISGNMANDDGGGSYFSHSHPTISDCTISNNSASDGGGIYCANGSSPTITDCTTSGNTPDNIVGASAAGLRGETGPSIITLENSTICGTGEHIKGVLIEHRGENHISDCIDEGDLNGDGDVDANDLDSLHASLGICPHDIDHDGDTDVEDLLRFLDGYGTTCP